MNAPILGFLVLSFSSFFGTASAAEPAVIGTTYSHRQSGYLEINDKEAYLSILDLGFNRLRLGAYWDEIEKEKDVYRFETLDWQIAEAGKRGIPVILTVGMKAPRWPEYFIPDWIEKQIRVKKGGEVTQNEFLKARTLKFIRAVVMRYKDNPAVRYWQVENEPLDRSGPKYWWIGKEFLKKEVDLVRSLDPTRPVILTVATYPNTLLFLIARFHLGPHPIYTSLALCDILGINVYPVVGSKFWEVKFYFWSNPSERAEYFTKVRRLAERRGKEPWIMELQAEPWEPGMLVHLGGDEPPTGNVENVRWSFREFQELGYRTIFLWGAEYWKFRELRHKDKRWWRMATDLIRLGPKEAHAASAHEEKDDALAAFSIYDLNNNGLITRYEGPKSYNWEPGLFDRRDLDGDEAITRDEFIQTHA